MLVKYSGNGTSILCFLKNGGGGFYPPSYFHGVSSGSWWSLSVHVLPGHSGREDHTFMGRWAVGPGLAHEARHEVMGAAPWVRYLSG